MLGLITPRQIVTEMVSWTKSAMTGKMLDSLAPQKVAKISGPKAMGIV
jgi:hypothetical protein